MYATIMPLWEKKLIGCWQNTHSFLQWNVSPLMAFINFGILGIEFNFGFMEMDFIKPEFVAVFVC